MDTYGNLIKTNKYQTQITEELLASLPDEVQEKLFDFINNVPFIQNLISNKREYAKDRPRDSFGRIIIDLANPHIIENTDYFRPAALHYMKYGCFTKLKPNSNPNSEYQKWFREEVRRCWRGYVRPSDGEWVTGYLYFFLNYSPMMLNKIRKGTKQADRVYDFPEFWEGIYWRFHYMEQANSGGIYNDWQGGNHCAELASRGKGKALAYSQIVPTPLGDRLWKDIQIGDLLFDDNGNTTKVIDIPFNEKTAIYKVTLVDGRTIKCSSGHLFNVRKFGKIKTLPLIDILKDYKKTRPISYRNPKGAEYIYSIPNNKSVEYDYQHIDIDPYTLGLLLGDGCFRTNYVNIVKLTMSNEDFTNIRHHIPYTDNKLKRDVEHHLLIPSIKLFLQRYDLHNKKSEDKHIPKDYIINTKEVRFNLLKGLLDSDGTVNNNGIPMITTSSKQLAEDIQYLCRSLGYNTRCFIKQAGYKKDGVKIECLPCYNISIFTNDLVFNLKRKSDLLTSFSSNYSRSRRDFTTIVDIQEIGEEYAKCVTVDSASHCFLSGDYVVTHNSYSLASILTHDFTIGVNALAKEKITSIVTAYQKEYLTKDGVLNKFVTNSDFLAENTQFPRGRLQQSFQQMTWKMGYRDAELDIEKGTKNTVLGVSSKDDESKIRGKRAAHILIEEFGSFPRLTDLYNVLIPSVQEGDIVFGQIFMLGTAGDNESDFAGACEIMYAPKGYNMYGIPNVYDKINQGRKEFVFFFPGYVNRKGCYDEDGTSDVIKALIEILMNRHRVKNNASDPNTIIKTIAEIPITPAEAIVKTGVNIFPVTDLTERLNQIDADPAFYDSMYSGTLVLNGKGEPEFALCNTAAIRDFPYKETLLDGAIDFHQMPVKDKDGKVYSGRYIAGMDPYDADALDGSAMSLGSMWVLDLWTDEIVCEYTARPNIVDDYFEMARRICIFYNAKLNYENNKKGLFSYFSQRNCLYLLTDVLEFLKDKQMVKSAGFGNTSKGTAANQAVNAYARSRVRDWLLTPKTHLIMEDGEEKEISTYNLYSLKSRALIKELIAFNMEGNFDRISGLMMLMLLREEKMILFQGDLKTSMESTDKNYLGEDPFFKKNSNKTKRIYS